MSRKRNYRVIFRVSEEELIRLKDKMALASCNPGVTISSYLRNCALGKDIVVIPGIRDLIIDMRSINNNLNQINNKINNGTVTVLGDNFKDVKEDLRAAWGKLAKITKKI